MKIEIAAYKNTKYDWINFIERSYEKQYKDDPEHVRVTEWTEVELPDADQGEITREMVNAIDEKIKQEQAESQNRITNLERRKQELLALTVAA